jgi:hypothetical protein
MGRLLRIWFATVIFLIENKTCLSLIYKWLLFYRKKTHVLNLSWKMDMSKSKNWQSLESFACKLWLLTVKISSNYLQLLLINEISELMKEIDTVIRLVRTWYMLSIFLLDNIFFLVLSVKCFVKFLEFLWERAELISFYTAIILILWLNSTKPF